jgi:hypothetical protein
MQKPILHTAFLCMRSLLVMLTFIGPYPAFAENSVTSSGRLDLRGVDAQNNDSVKEAPSATGLFKLDAEVGSWRLHSWLEGGWDGSVRKPVQYHSLFKDFDRVYQDNTPFLEIKELSVTRNAGDTVFRAGIQRFAWGRLDEYPPNDLLNPWDYSQFLRKPLEDRKIGVPSVSAELNRTNWSYDLVWIPVFVPYRLPMPYERWSGVSSSAALSQIPNAEIVPSEPGLPDRTIGNGSFGFRVRRLGEIEWALNLFSGYDPKPVFKTTALVIAPRPGGLLIDPGYEPDLHRISSIGMDAAAVQGDLSVRAEAAYIMNRYLNIRRDLWGYPSIPAPGIYPLKPIEIQSDSLEYGMGADYRLFEDGTLTVQAQQTLLLNHQDALYERKIETMVWMNLKIGWLNQKIETNKSVAWNPEHGAIMSKFNAWYIFTDAWKAGITAIILTGPSQSIFGRYARNDQAEAELVYSW